MNDGREGHYGEGYVWNVVQKRADKAVFDGLADQSERENADYVGNSGGCENCEGDVEVFIHLSTPVRFLEAV